MSMKYEKLITLNQSQSEINLTKIIAKSTSLLFTLTLPFPSNITSGEPD